MNGTLVVIVTAAGHVAATEADFEQGAAVGYTEPEMQELRALKEAWRRVMQQFCHPDIGKAMTAATLHSVACGLVNAGWKVHVTPVSAGEASGEQA